MFLYEDLEQIDFSKYKRIVVSYSGGVDSLVLLHALNSITEFKQKLFALHVNHGINQASSTWEKHCENTCSNLGINFVSLKIKLDNQSNASENHMRQARYRALLAWIKKDDVLCTGHHKDDHVETVFFRLLRGTGIKGLSGIKKFSTIKGTDLVRPLLDYSKKDLKFYAKNNKLKWIEDETNEDISFSRNLIRKNIFPLLKNQNWPSYVNALSHLSRRAKEANEILEEVGDEDIKHCSTDTLNRLSILKIKGFSKVRIKNLLYRWISLKTDLDISSHLLDEIYKNILFTKENSDPIVSLGKPGRKDSFQLRRFNGILHYLPLIESDFVKKNETWKWNLSSSLVLPTGVLSIETCSGEGLSSNLTKKRILVKVRSGGERCKPKGRSKSQKLKKLLLEYEVPPWLRNRLPLVYVDNKLAAVSNLWVCEEFTAKRDEKGIVLSWTDTLDN